MSECDRVQELFAERDPAAVERDAAAREHLAGCAYCQQVLAALAPIDAALARLPAEDAPEATVARVAAAVGAPPAVSPARRQAGTFGGPGWAAVAASVLVVVAAATLLWPQYRAFGPPRLPGLQTTVGGEGELAQTSDAIFSIASGVGAAAGYRESDGLASPGSAGDALAPLPGRPAPRGGFDQDGRRAGERSVLVAPAPPRDPVVSIDELMDEPTGLDDARDRDEAFANERAAALTEFETRNVPDAEVATREQLPGKAVSGRSSGHELKQEAAKRDTRVEHEAERRREQAKRSSNVARRADKPASIAPSPAPLAMRSNETAPASAPPPAPPESLLKPLLRGLASEPREPQPAGSLQRLAEEARQPRRIQPDLPARAKDLATASATATDRAQARAYLAERERLEGLEFLPSGGYWSNTYLPGDPARRLLELRLREWDRSSFPSSFASLRLERRARPNWQPFDPPADAALAAYLQADRTAVSGRSRVRLQVGLRGAERRGGHRPAMNVAVVVDHRQALGQVELVRVRALLEALAGARQPGDRFSLTTAGGGVEVPPEAFRHGPLTIALEALAGAPGRSPTASLRAAMAAAAAVAAAGDDPSAPIGASVVLLLASAPFGGEAAAIESLVHANALAGIVTSAVAVSDAVDEASIARLVLLGQGRRAVLRTAADASAVVDRELHAASRAVARAVRLRIQLAPGVRLVEVLGARRLDEPAAERVRQAELSIDRRLARNLGIVGDRGEDEAGVQIIIPHFYAGDAHVVLLDVVVDGPGPVADLTVRYKDLVRLANGTTRASLALAAGESTPGPLERNVLKNELAQRLSETIRQASALVAAGDPGVAASLLERRHALIAALRLEIAELHADPELVNDQALLAEYVAVLRSRIATLDAARGRIADSLLGAAGRRLLAPPPHEAPSPTQESSE